VLALALALALARMLGQAFAVDASRIAEIRRAGMQRTTAYKPMLATPPQSAASNAQRR